MIIDKRFKKIVIINYEVDGVRTVCIFFWRVKGTCTGYLYKHIGLLSQNHFIEPLVRIVTLPACHSVVKLFAN